MICNNNCAQSNLDGTSGCCNKNKLLIIITYTLLIINIQKKLKNCMM